MKFVSGLKSSSAVLLFAIASLFLLAAPSFAGHYDVAYSGGTYTQTIDGAQAAHSYTYHDWDGTYGASYFYTNWGQQQQPDGSIVTFNGLANCSGAITATFTWVSDQPDDETPSAVVIAETCNATWYGWDGADDGYAAVAPTGSAANGLGFAEDQNSSSWPSPPGVEINGTSSGTRYKTKQKPGNTFTITCSPSVHVSDSGSAHRHGDGTAELRYEGECRTTTSNTQWRHRATECQELFDRPARRSQP